MGEKIEVTDYAMAHWMAQSCGLDINEWPRHKPDHMPKSSFDQLKKSLRPYSFSTEPSHEQQFYHFLKSQMPEEPQVFANPKKLTKDPNRLNPIVFPKTKKVTKFTELFKTSKAAKSV